jgi:hypothetical protein
MSSQPIQMPIPKQEELAKAKRRAALRSDLLYLAGAVLVTIGVGLIRVKFGLITAGGFCLLPPGLELASGFIRGLRTQRR